MKQTALKWLENNLIFDPWAEEHFKHNEECWEIAKEMEKQQIMNAYEDGAINGYKSGVVRNNSSSDITPEQYFAETYGSKKSDEHIEHNLDEIEKSKKPINPNEISDEQIECLAKEHILYNDAKRQWLIEGMKLYREQLKKK